MEKFFFGIEALGYDDWPLGRVSGWTENETQERASTIAEEKDEFSQTVPSLEDLIKYSQVNIKARVARVVIFAG